MSILWDKWVRGVRVWLLPKLECCLNGIQYILEYIRRGSKLFDQTLKLGHANVIKLFLGDPIYIGARHYSTNTVRCQVRLVTPTTFGQAIVP